MKYLCYYELHTDCQTFVVHTIVEASDSDAALGKLKSQHGDSYHLQAKGCLGEFTPDLAIKFLGGYLVDEDSGVRTGYKE